MLDLKKLDELAELTAYRVQRDANEPDKIKIDIDVLKSELIVEHARAIKHYERLQQIAEDRKFTKTEHEYLLELLQDKKHDLDWAGEEFMIADVLEKLESNSLK